jgi:metal-dependent amidase/aminoacylase/carboxypeptidase family protein
MSDDDFVLVDHSDVLPYGGEPPEYLGDVDELIDRLSGSLWDISKQIHDNPELGYKEYKAHALLTSFMKSRNGWEVTPSAYGINTAWVAVFDSGKKGPVVSFNVEMGTCLYTGS